jgi:mono/diheme cytochrome c family protein
MYTIILLWLITVAITILFGWLVRRAWRSRNVILKWGGTILSGLLTLVVGAVSILALIGMIKVYVPRNYPVEDIKIAGTPEQIARGEHLANAFCASCHSTNQELPLTGGLDLGADFPIPLGSFVSVNLTPAGPLKDWTDGEIKRVLRYGVDRNGRVLLLMSNVYARYMSDEDMEAVIAYLRNTPPVPNETLDPPDQPTFLAAIMSGAGMLPEGLPAVNGSVTAPPRGPTLEYGEYLLSFQDCRGCHGEELTGGVEGQLAPIGPNLRVVKGWTQEQFITTIRTGVDPAGWKLREELMPWPNIARMDDDELAAMYLYLASLP